MTQKELADAIGMSKYGDRTIRRWENGESAPSAIELKSILDFPEEIPFANNTAAPYKMIDLFAGIGGTRLGFHLTGKTRSVFSSEIDKFAIKTYHANFGETPWGDITMISENDIPDHDILVGGFPCQAFSQAGKNPRKLTPREAARLQGFPDNYIIPVSDTQAYKQFGNSVAVPVVNAIASEMINVLDHIPNGKQSVHSPQS